MKNPAAARELSMSHGRFKAQLAMITVIITADRMAEGCHSVAAV